MCTQDANKTTRADADSEGQLPPAPVLAPDWQSRARLVQRRNSVANADVYAVEIDGRKLLAKTYANNPAWARLLFGRLALRHEYHIMAELGDLPGVPHAYGVYWGNTLLMDYVRDSRTVEDRRELSRDQYPPLAFFEKLCALIDEMHGRGIAHGDMRRRNILRTKNEEPFLVDFATAVHRRRYGPLSRLLFHMLRQSDRFGAGKLRLSYYPDSLPEEEKERILHKPWYLSIGRFLRKRVYRKWIKQRRWRQRIEAWRQTTSQQED